MADGNGAATGERRRLVVNPESGTGDHVDRVRRLAEEYGFTVEETRQAGHAIDLAERAAADGVDLLGVCGGDGTVHEVVRGLAGAEALDSVTLCVVPAGTANVVAGELGIPSLREGFDVATRGETRRLDLGVAGDEPFVMSAIAGLPAEASAAASTELKEQLGTFAFVVEGLRESRDFDGRRVSVAASAEAGEVAWTGDALSLLVGNLRRFHSAGGQADAEDGLFDVTIVEQMLPTEAIAAAIEQRFFPEQPSAIEAFRAVSLEITSLDDAPMTVSLDGEIRSLQSVDVSIRPGALRVRVGEDYEPRPHEDAG